MKRRIKNKIALAIGRGVAGRWKIETARKAIRHVGVSPIQGRRILTLSEWFTIQFNFREWICLQVIRGDYHPKRTRNRAEA